MNSTEQTIRADVANYYAARIQEHGATARGVDWNGAESQELRFSQLTKLIEPTTEFSLNDVGCGYGALLPFLLRSFERFSYFGCDISPDMITAARKYGHDTKSIDAKFSVSQSPETVADYCIASGIFNVRVGRPDETWRSYILDTLDIFDRNSRRGFAFNCLTSYSDPEKMRSDLYYADPCELFDHCKKRYSRNVALLHDYELFEFTILVRKSDA